MSKKHRRRLAARRTQLQRLESKGTSELTAAVSSPEKSSADSPVSQNSSAPVLALDYSWQRELRQTTFAVLIVAILLAGLTIAGKHYGYTDTFGNWLYSWLRLS